MAKRGYNRDTIRGGASEWDVSRPVSSYLRLLGRLVAHPVAFFEVLPRVPDVRAPAGFLVFSGVLCGGAWLLAGGALAAAAGLLAPLPLSLLLAALFHLATWGGRHGYAVTWRVVAYPLGLYLPLTAVPGARWAGWVCVAAGAIPVGLSVVRELPLRRTFPAGAAAAAGVLAAALAGW
ncbi:hypothetical protein [Rubrobacter xylanophilus]|uniref:hypothetical protein n=1 Tax=Rubrobacter xylanophilus TaxID=49319 RepID=UPI00003A21DD|nr:hypothetical protein [Rubrobacter xylanophilus]